MLYLFCVETINAKQQALGVFIYFNVCGVHRPFAQQRRQTQLSRADGRPVSSVLVRWRPAEGTGAGLEWGHFSAREFQAQDQPTFFMVVEIG